MPMFFDPATATAREHMLNTVRSLYLKCQSDMTNELIRGGMPPAIAQATATEWCYKRVLANHTTPTVQMGIPKRVGSPGPGVPSGGRKLLGPY